jgi:DNA-binding NarL/FixJ family response regulator
MSAVRTRVIIADDHAVVRRGVRALLEPLQDFEICGEAENGVQAVALAEELRPDIAILDVSMPEMNGLDAAKQIRERWPAVEILLLTLHASEELARRAFELGARGYVLKSDAERDLIVALRQLQGHHKYISPALGLSADCEDSPEDSPEGSAADSPEHFRKISNDGRIEPRVFQAKEKP